MWCIPEVTDEFIERMEHIVDLYHRPYSPDEPVICFDEKNTQLIEDTRHSIPTAPGKPRKRDYEYRRNGTANVFVAVEPAAGYRGTRITPRRTKADFAREIKRLVDLPRYRNAVRIHIVLDNLNTHFASSLYETFTADEAHRILSKIEFHYTPPHASWLNMAEIEIGILGRQCLKRRAGTMSELRANIRIWKHARNRHRMKIHWRWTKEDARKVFKYEP